VAAVPAHLAALAALAGEVICYLPARHILVLPLRGQLGGGGS
jgi:hypothetical protein